MKTTVFTVCLALHLLYGNDTLRIDLDNSKITWIGRIITGEHSGTLDLSESWIIAEDNIIKNGQLLFDMNSINTTDIESIEWKLKLDNHLKNEDFFAADSFPYAILNINESQLIDNESIINNYIINAELTIRGISNSISFPISLTKTNNIFSAQGEVDIDRTLYNIKYKSSKYFLDLGDKIIYDMFSVQFTLQTKSK